MSNHTTKERKGEAAAFLRLFEKPEVVGGLVSICEFHCDGWTRIEQGRQPSPSEAVLDSQSVKSAAGVHEAVGFDAGKQIKGRKRFTTVDTLGLVLRVFVTAASTPEREGGKKVLQRVQQRGQAVSRLHTIWVDGGFDGSPFMQWVITVCR